MLPCIDKPGWFRSKNVLDTMGYCDPFVRISMDGPKAVSENLSNMQRRVIFPDPIKVRTKAGCRRAKVTTTFCDGTPRSSFVPNKAENLIGEFPHHRRIVLVCP